MKNIDFNEGNRLIADFMGLNPIVDNNGVVYRDTNTGHLMLIRYHSSWDWLIPVIDKAYECQLFGSNNLINDIKENLVILNIEETYKAVIEFIKYYNSQNNL